MDGVTYKPGEVAILELNVVPQFGLIVHIIIEDNHNYYLVCKVLTAECFNSHFHSYQVFKENCLRHSYKIYKITNIADHNCPSCYTISSYPSYYFIPLKYYLVDTVYN